MKEEFLHHIWRFRLYDFKSLQTTDGSPVQVIHPGHLNPDAGPDFLDARIRIGKTLWAGNVEIHLQASDWYKHQHDRDPAYDSVVLHVVYEADTDVRLKNGIIVPAIELKERIPVQILEKYYRLSTPGKWIPCSGMASSVKPVVVKSWISRMAAERLESKTAQNQQLLQAAGNDWEEGFYRALAAAFGLNTNKDAFLALAESLPVKILARHTDNPLQIEALLFGQSGLLNSNLKESYPQQLIREYRFLREKYGLEPIAPHRWKFLRMRPASFPTIRIAQLAAVIANNPMMFSGMMELEDIDEIRQQFFYEPSPYWKNHYTFGKVSAVKSKKPGEVFIQSLIINTVVPWLFLYGKLRKKPELINRALYLLEQLPAESNAIIRNWKSEGIPVDSAHDTQALLHLKKNYCDHLRCLQCAMGVQLMK